jgi:hypothetical protein
MSLVSATEEIIFIDDPCAFKWNEEQKIEKRKKYDGRKLYF